MTDQRIAILGLGAMGARIAANLVKAGYPLIAWNRSAEAIETLKASLHRAKLTIATTPKQAAEQADIVISMVTDDDASRAVWLTPNTGAAFGLKTDAIAIECSTLTVSWTQELAKAIKTRNAAFIEAPVVGSRPQTEAQKLICLVGGSANTLAKVHPILSATAVAIHHVGTVGQGMAMKLAVNALFGIQVAALAELLGTLAQQGIDPSQAMTCLNEMPVTSPAAKGASALITAQKHPPLFPINLVEKDFRYAREMAAGNHMPTTSAIQQIYESAIKQGYGSENITAIARIFESNA